MKSPSRTDIERTPGWPSQISSTGISKWTLRTQVRKHNLLVRVMIMLLAPHGS